MSTVVVALVLLSSASRKYLIVRRDKNQSGAGFWEFPGGKVEQGETLESALVREIQEELSLSIDVKRLQFLSRNTHQYLTKLIDISFFLYQVSQEIPVVLVDHDDFVWCDVDDLSKYSIAEADLPVIKQLKKTRPVG
ncbi:MAG: (deoxy)nucleoside triphosphate pyrophosphohydrolase [Moraxellaceae bacterium]|nr:(deoxy)nucleoside triphosphate pyrophosphohydrolase [Pseudobdellovibrionaceae bacterium]